MTGYFIGLAVAFTIGVGLIVGTGIQIARKTIKASVSAVMLLLGFVITFMALFFIFSKLK